MQNVNQFDEHYAREQLRRSQHLFRRLIKRFYLNNVVNDVIGPTLDVGCGAGQLLDKLPNGSLGLDINVFLINELTALGKNVSYYDLIEDNCRFSGIPTNTFKTLVLSHVLEHFDEAAVTMRKLFAAASTLGIARIIIVVPGKLGYASDSTHRTFIDNAYITNNQLERCSGYQITKRSHFPLPNVFGDHFIYEELKLIYDQAETA